MSLVELRRHSVRNLPEEHLSDAGRSLAEDVGRTRGPFQLVVSSPAARARETALAMGFHPTELDALWHELGDGSIPWPLSFREMGLRFEHDAVARAVAVRLQEAIRDLTRRVSESGAVLLIAHGGVPELVAASWFPLPVLDGLGPPCKCLEGISLSVERGKAVAVEALRVPDHRTRI
jgi:broad specificity phosphatase PhoE